ncbi:sporulation protein [Paenibacillus allorhizosphaerae]|uniref:Sporulation-control protein spo0M n=1 Tax=Paenibacillus allorhizosphaerae TaxID=2849866 RepID=A0ABN7TSC2_9BACL|nr:sporulation protein [Paenibacillus allorhizosphaerae]CAG7653229.1 Sporulation-control protein spo0M [Paenibacillus allorhizosphaerae]
MSFFKKVLASVGVGSAKVDTQLESGQIAVGEELRGVVHIQGGQLEQQIDSIYLYIKTSYVKEENDRKVTVVADVAKFRITDEFLLAAGERTEIPFAFTVPEYTPVSLRNSAVWLETGLDIKMAVDPTDRDYVDILPHPHMQVILDALDELGFRLREVTNDYAPRIGGKLPFIQEFEFVPTTHFRGALDELEVVFFLRGDELELYLQIDRRARGIRGLFSEAAGMDESFVRVAIPGDELRRGPSVVARNLKQLISNYS